MAFSFSHKLTFDHTKVPSDQTNYVARFIGTFPALRNVAYGGEVQDPNGYDIYFSPDQYCFDTLNWWIIQYDQTTGTIEVAVQIPTLSSSVDTVIYIFCGDPTLNFDDFDFPWDSSIYQGVWCFPDGTTLNAQDFSRNNYSGTITGAASAAAGQLDGAALFPSSADALIDIGDRFRLQNTYSSPTTLSFWVTSNSGPVACPLVSKTDNSTSGFLVLLEGTKLSFILVRATANEVWSKNVAIPANGSENHVAITYDGNVSNGSISAILYLNGAPVSWDNYIAGSGAFASDSGTSYQIGGSSFYTGANGRLDGTIDDHIYQFAVATADLIATDYNNQSSPSTFFTLGPGLALPIINSFDAHPGIFVIHVADSTTLRWNISGAASASIDGYGAISPPTIGSLLWPIPAANFGFNIILRALSAAGGGAYAVIRINISQGGFIPIGFSSGTLPAQANTSGPFYEGGYVYYVSDVEDIQIGFSPNTFAAQIQATRSITGKFGEWDSTVGIASRPSFSYGPDLGMNFTGVAHAEYLASGVHIIYSAVAINDPTFGMPGWWYLYKLDLLLPNPGWTLLAQLHNCNNNQGIAITVDQTNGDCYILYVPAVEPPNTTSIAYVSYSYATGVVSLPVGLDGVDDTPNSLHHAFHPEQVMANAGTAYFIYSLWDISLGSIDYKVKGPGISQSLPDPGYSPFSTTVYRSKALSRPVFFQGKFYFTITGTTQNLAIITIAPSGPLVYTDTGVQCAVSRGVSGNYFGANSQFFVINGKLMVFYRSGPFNNLSFIPAQEYPNYYFTTVSSTLTLGTINEFPMNNLGGDFTVTNANFFNLMPYLIPDTGRLAFALSWADNSSGLENLFVPTVSVPNPFPASTAAYIVGKGNFGLG